MTPLLLNKKYLAFILITLLIQPVILKANEPSCKKVVIQYVDFDILTTADVTCPQFNMEFNDQIQTLTIINSKKIKVLTTLLKNLKFDRAAKSMDVRTKINLYYKHKIEVICLDKFNVLKGDTIYEMDKKLLWFVKRLETHK